jgi:hypothetical protein
VDESHEQAIFRVACELHIDGGPEDRLRVLVRELLEVQVDFVGSLLRRAEARRLHECGSVERGSAAAAGTGPLGDWFRVRALSARVRLLACPAGS